MTELERKAQIRAQMEVGKRVRLGQKPTKQEIHDILEEKRHEVGLAEKSCK